MAVAAVAVAVAVVVVVVARVRLACGEFVEWQDIPVIVLTVKDLTEENRRMLSGRVEQIVEKGASTHEQLVSLVRRVVDHIPTYNADLSTKSTPFN